MPRQYTFSQNGRRTTLLLTGVMAELVLLAVQFVIGMWINLFALFPITNVAFPMYGMMNVMFSVPELMVHMMNGVLIGLLSLMIFVMSLMGGFHKSAMLSAIASFSIFLAGMSGLEFILSGFQNNILSFTMSLGFVVAIISYVFLIYFASTYSQTQRLHL
ncbi:MAG: hypothetical protein ACYCT2_01315 [Thermoplasmataceae archaeon]